MLAAMLVGSSGARAQTLIDTTPTWDPNSGICAFGVGLEYPPTGESPPAPYVTTWGQVVTAPATDPILDSFAVYLSWYPFGGHQLVMRAAVYAWEGTKAAGDALWESAPRTVDLGSLAQEVSFDTGGVALDADRRYVLFLSVSKDYERSEPQTGACTGAVYPSVYDGGDFVVLSDEGDETLWTRTAWRLVDDHDLAFRALFATGPSCLDLRASKPVRRPATLLGTAGADVLKGTAGSDVIVGLGGDDRIHAHGGDDVVCAGSGRDQVDAGTGHDSVIGDDGSDLLRGGRGDDRISGDTPGSPERITRDRCHGQQGSDLSLDGTCEQRVGIEGVL
jgi:hypothetical protein